MQARAAIRGCHFQSGDMGQKMRQNVVQTVRSARILGLLTTGLLLAAACTPVLGGDKPVIKLYDGQWESLWVNNALAIDKVAHRGLLENAPDVVEMLRRMLVGLEPLSETLAWAKENNVEDWEEAAIYYLQNYEERWETWVTPEAYERIKKALEEASR